MSCTSRTGTPGSSVSARSRLASDTADTPTTACSAARKAAPSTAPTLPAPMIPTPRRPGLAMLLAFLLVMVSCIAGSIPTGRHLRHRRVRHCGAGSCRAPIGVGATAGTTCRNHVRWFAASAPAGHVPIGRRRAAGLRPARPGPAGGPPALPSYGGPGPPRGTCAPGVPAAMPVTGSAGGEPAPVPATSARSGSTGPCQLR